MKDRFKAYRIASNASVLHLDLGRSIINRAFNSLNVSKFLSNDLSSVSEIEQERKTLFVSYSHKDLVWLERLRTHLWPVVKTCKDENKQEMFLVEASIKINEAFSANEEKVQ